MCKNIMRTTKEKEEIVKEYLQGAISTRAIAEKYETSQGVFNRWLRNYREYGIEGLISQTGKKTGGTKGQGKKPKTELEKIKYDLLKKEIEVARLKKGYTVKGVGVKKEYITTFDANMK